MDQDQQAIFTGVADDARSDEEKMQDYQAVEVAALPPIEWQEKTTYQWRKFPIRNQNGSSTCVAQTGAKLLGIDNQIEENNFLEFSARDIYSRRTNKPNTGMWGQDALQLCSKIGSTLESRLPSENMTEAEIDAPFTLTADDQAIEDKYRAGGYVQLPLDIDAIASVIEFQKKGVMIFVSFDSPEWTDVPQVLKDNPPYRHSITAVDAIMWEGEKALVIDDSWGRFNAWQGQRVLKESFLKARLFFAGYLLNLSNNRPENIQPPKPKYYFKNVLLFEDPGVANNTQDVKALQDILKYEQLFPQSVQSTGRYLQITAKAVLAFQRKYSVASPDELNALQGRRCGPKTVAKLNELYS